MLKLVALVALFAGFCWVGTHLQLGSHTLFGHLRAIAQTKESQDLFDGTRESAGPLVDDVRRRIAGVPATAKTPAPAVEEADDAPANNKGELAKTEDAKPTMRSPTRRSPIRRSPIRRRPIRPGTSSPRRPPPAGRRPGPGEADAIGTPPPAPTHQLC